MIKIAKIGYCRVSTEEQSLNMQLDALKKEGCVKIFHDVITGKKKERPGLEKCFEHLRDGEDTLVIFKLDRFSRSLKDLLDLSSELMERNINLVSLNDPIDTTTPSGRLYFQLIGAFSEFESSMISFRTKEGLQAVKRRGKKLGRKEVDKKVIERAIRMHQTNEFSVKEILETCGIGQGTFYKYLKVYLDIEDNRKKDY